MTTIEQPETEKPFNFGEKLRALDTSLFEVMLAYASSITVPLTIWDEGESVDTYADRYIKWFDSPSNSKQVILAGFTPVRIEQFIARVCYNRNIRHKGWPTMNLEGHSILEFE